MTVIDPSKMCIYCGRSVGRQKKGEHIIPKSIGGKLTLNDKNATSLQSGRIRRVCTKCNGKCSVIDEELASKSPIHHFVWQVLGRNPLGVFDYDAKEDLLVEARPLPDNISPAIWPQVILMEGKTQIRVDEEDLKQFGAERCFSLFYQFAKNARKSLDLSKRKRRWIWEKMKSLPKLGKYPPRVFTPHGFDEFDDRITFICRYAKHYRQQHILSQFDNWQNPKGNCKVEMRLGMKDPPAMQSWRPHYVVRALVKIAVNTLAYFCENTEVNFITFPKAVEFALYGDRPFTHKVILEDIALSKCPGMFAGGFLIHDNIRALNCPDNAHKIELNGALNVWHAYFAFFGGAIGAAVRFPGPNNEKWSRLEVIAPLDSKDWSCQKHELAIPRDVLLTEHIGKMAPSILMKNINISLRKEPE